MRRFPRSGGLRGEVNGYPFAYVYFESGQALSGALDDTPALPGDMRVAIMRDEKPSDELVEWMTDVLNNCHRTGMILSYIVSSTSPNGSVIVVRVDGENVDVLAEHYEDGAFRLPMTIAVIDQKNEVVLVTVGSKSRSDLPLKK